MNNRGYSLFELIIVLGVAVSVGLAGLGIYVLIHFLAKFW